jgi:flavorubredoxin
MLEPRNVADATWQLGFAIPIPGLGVLPGNAFVIQAREPVLVDTGIAALRQEFFAALARVIDPEDLKWIYITHMDLDHVGNLAVVLERAPRARVVTTFVGMAKMGLLGLPQDRCHLVNPGQALDAGDRRLHVLRPPTFDAPETTGFFDERSRALFTSDSFGAVLPELPEDAAQIEPAILREGMHRWASVDAPWLAMAGRAPLAAAIAHMRDLRPEVLLSSHLLPARGLTDRLAAYLAETAGLAPFVGPDQQALEEMMGLALEETA